MNLSVYGKSRLFNEFSFQWIIADKISFDFFEKEEEKRFPSKWFGILKKEIYLDSIKRREIFIWDAAHKLFWNYLWSKNR